MDTSTLMAISPLDGRYADKLTALRSIFSEFGLIKFRLTVEVKWVLFLAQSKRINELPALSIHAENILLNLIESFSEQDALRVKNIEAGINHDVKAVEYFIKERIGQHAELQHAVEFIHFGCTSEDINNLAYALMLKTALQQALLPPLDDIVQILREMAHAHAALPMLARTHGQPASPTTLGKEMANVIARLQREYETLVNVALLGKLNGASGNFNALVIAYPELDWQQLSEQFVHSLNLTWNPYTTQIEPHDYLAEFFHAVSRINTILIDFCRDTWGYISLGYLKQQSVKNEVGSSTMPHKVNPIDFENSEGNLGIANALLQHMAEKLPISRFQRDLSDSTVLRNMGVAFGHAILAYQSALRGIRKITPDQERIAQDLEAHWEILGEAIQTIMRRYGCEMPYEQLKALTRGKTIEPKELRAFIDTLPLPAQAKKALLELTPSLYTGYADDLAKRI